jgi:plastocyanin
MLRVHPLRTAFLLLASLLILMIGSQQSAQAERAANQDTIASTLPARQDAYVHASRPDTNFGDAHLAVGPSAHAFVQFDLSTLPRAAQIERAVFRLKPFRLPDSEPVEVQLGKVEAAWAEGRVTWNNKPAITPGGPTVAVADLDWVEWTVTELVQRWHAGREANHGLGVYTTNPGQGLLFHSRETGSAPELVISLQGNDDDQPGELRISQQVETAGELVRRGEVVTYTIHLRHEGGTAPLQAELRTVLSAVEYLAPGVYVEEVSFRATPLRVRVEQSRDAEGRPHQVVSWRGTLEPDAELKFTLPVYVRAACAPGAATQTVVNETIARVPGGDPLRALAEYTLACPQASLDDIDVTLELGGDEINWLFEPGAVLAGANHTNRAATNMQVQVRTTLTNRSQEQAIVGYQLETRYIGETERNLDAYSPSSIVILGPGESRTFGVWTDMRPLSYRLNQLESTAFATASSQAEDDDELAVEFVLHYTLLPTARPSQPVDFTDATRVRTVTRPVRIRAWDLGDAPDSTNHAGAPMEAYPGVRANFPTVFDPAVSNPQGPAHARPRHFHLGRSVDPEVDADLGPAPNIDPTAGSADHDLFDDGAVPHAWNLTHCRPTTIEVRIFVSPAAADWFRDTGRQGYLNGWIDANRDGDWADNVRCPADELSSPPVALEHFIIDQPMDVAALGAGYHAVSVQTGRVPWPADRVRQPAWVRLTLSERPSAKVGTISGIDYGDGRGHAQPFRTGETEDYLLRPAGSPGAGPDMQVTVTGGWQPSPLRPVSPVAAGFTYQKIEWTFRVDFANVGSEAAADVVLNVDVPEGLRGHDAELALVAPRRDAQTIYLIDSERDAEVVQVSDDRITVRLGTVEPGQRGRLLLTFRPEIGDEVVTSYMTKADVISLRDVNPGNNSASFKVEIAGMAQGAFGFRSPGSPYLVRSGATNSPTLILEGVAPRGLLLPAVQLWVHRLLDAARTDAESSEVYEAPVDADGRWSLQLDNLPDGFYQFAVGDPGACDVYGYNQAETLASSLRTLAGNDNEWRLHRYGTVCGLAVVDSTLDVDPLSMTFTEVTGLDVERNARVFLPDTLGWSQGNWRVRLFDTNPEDGATRPSVASSPREYKVAINARSHSDVTGLGELILSITGFGSFETKLVEGAVPGRYETHFIIGDGGGMPGVVAAALPDRELAISLRLENEVRQVQYDGELRLESPGMVVDAVTGSGVAGASITLLSAAARGDELVFAPWDGGEQGQANPIQTAADGSYSLTAPAGSYQLYVTAPGYQPYRRAVLSRGGLITPTITLAPMPADKTSFVVALTENGFQPSLRAVKPGATVSFINMDEKPRRLIGSGSDSGLLAPGASFRVVAGAEGVMAYLDVDVDDEVVLMIDPNAEEIPIGLPPREGEEEEDEEEDEEFGSQSLFLPLVSR